MAWVKGVIFLKALFPWLFIVNCEGSEEESGDEPLLTFPFSHHKWRFSFLPFPMSYSGK